MPRALAVILIFCIGVAAQVSSPAITVNDNPLLTVRPVTRIANDWFLPLVAIAQAVGAELRISGQPQQLSVRRADGTTVTYDNRSGEIRTQAVLIGRVKAYEQVQITAVTDDLLFPLNGLVALLGVDVYEDSERNLLVIQSRDASQSRPHSLGGSPLNVGTVDYNYGFAMNGADHGQFATVRSRILAGSIPTTEDLTLSQAPGYSQPRVTQGWMRADLSADRSLVIGDHSTYSGVDAFTDTVRGAGLQSQSKGLFTHFFAGRAVSTSFASVGPVSVLKYDTTLSGFSIRRAAKDKEFILAGNYFQGPDRRGTAVGAAYRIGSKADQFKIQSSIGRFSSATSQGWRPAWGLTATNTFNPAKYITIAGQLDQYGKNFLTVRDESRFTGQLNKSASVIFRPFQSLNFSGSMSDRSFLQTGRRSRNTSYGANGSLPGVQALQWSAFRSVQSDDGSTLGRFVLEQYSVSVPNMKSYSIYTYYSRLRLGSDLVRDVNLIILSDRGRYGRFGFHDQMQLGHSNRYGIDWSLQFASRDAFLRAAIDRSVDQNQTPRFAPSVATRLPLPGGHSFVLTFVRDGRSKMLQVELGGHMDRGREFRSDAASRAVVVVGARLSGRVYLDSDFNGAFDSKIDAPVRDVSVWMDDEKVARTDGQGLFRFENVSTNAHKLRAALDGVPAELVFADLPERTTAVIPYNENIVNFRVVRAGRITGRVSYTDHPAADIRIIASGDRDTFSEFNGNFLLSDLPPGTYDLRVDPETVPQSYVSKPEVMRIEVKPGRASDNVQFQLVIPPRPVIEKSLPEEQS